MSLYQRFKDRFGGAGVLIGVIALVLALVTGAYAAGGGLSGKQKKEVEKIAKKYAGKPGAPGAAGTNGTNGTNGKDGGPGAPGKDGVSVESSVEPKGANCKEGGSKFVAADGTTYACNGSPWTAGGTLPSGATETGTIALDGEYSAGANVVFPFSFPIPLSQSDAATIGEFVTSGFPFEYPHIHLLEPGEDAKLRAEEWHSGAGELCAGKSGNELTECEQAHEALAQQCPGTLDDPQAQSGNMCVYLHSPVNGLNHQVIIKGQPYFTVSGADSSGGLTTTSGGILHATAETPSGSPPPPVNVLLYGSWAITAS